jgi:transposase
VKKHTPLVIGLDVSDKHTHICVLDDAGAVVLRERIETRDPALRKWFARRAPARVALEVGRHSAWMSRVLTELGHEAVVANARKVRLVYESDKKNDQMDAESLARLARVDPALLHPVKHRRADTQAALAMVRSREVVVDMRTAAINSVRGQAKAFGGAMPSGHVDRFHEFGDEVPDDLRDAVTPLLNTIRFMTEQIRHYDRILEDLCAEVYPETEVLRQVWGVGPVTSLTFVLTIEEPGRFRRSRDVGSYFGLCPRQDQSGEVDKQLHITKAGDRLMRRYLVQCAQRILSGRGPDSDLRTWGLAIAARGGARAKRRALVAVARKLAVLLHRLWVTGSVYEPVRTKTTEAAA